MDEDADYRSFVAARRELLVEEFGGERAGAAVDRALAGCRPRWAHLAATTDVESHVRERVRAELDRPRRRRQSVVGLAVLACLVVLVGVLATRPGPPPVREVDNPVPVPWYSGVELHLAEVAVTLPDLGAFVARGDDVVVERGDGSLALVRADGSVADFEGPLPEVREAETLPERVLGPIAAPVQAVTGPDGVVVQLVELSAIKPVAEQYLRVSESERRQLIVCFDSTCERIHRETLPGVDARLS